MCHHELSILYSESFTSVLEEQHLNYFQNNHGTIMNTKHEKLKKNVSHSAALSTKTKEFLKKVCYKETASVDMTRNGFIKDSKAHIFQLLDRPLKKEDKHEAMKKNKTSPKIVTRKLLKSNGVKHEGPKVKLKKLQSKSVDVSKTKSQNNFIKKTPRKIKKM